jgi:hypothetical protein
MADIHPTYLEKLIDEVKRPIMLAAVVLMDEMRATANVPDAPWKILNKTYLDLTDEEITALMDIYHEQNEKESCQMCQWMATRETQEWTKDRESGL